MLLAGVIIISTSGLLYLRHCEWSPEEAARYATEHAEKKSIGMCALYVRKAIIAGGIPLYVGGDAWSFKYTLPILNFHQVAKKRSERLVILWSFNLLEVANMGISLYGMANSGSRTSSNETL